MLLLSLLKFSSKKAVTANHAGASLFLFLFSVLTFADLSFSNSYRSPEIKRPLKLSQINTTPKNVNDYVYILELSKSTNIEVSNFSEFENIHFEKFEAKVPTTKALLRIDIQNDTENPQEKVLYFDENSFQFVRFTKVHHHERSRIIHSSEAGVSVDPYNREFASSIPTTKFRLSPGENLRLYAFVKIELNNYFNVFIGNENSAFISDANEKTIMYIYIGLVTSMILYQVFLFYTFRNIVHIVYIGFGISMISCIYLGGAQIAYHFGPTDHLAYLFNIARGFTTVFVVAILLCLYTSVYKFGRLRTVGLGIIGTILFTLSINVLFDIASMQILSDIYSAVAIPFVIFLAVKAVLAKEAGSAVFLTAWIIFLTGVIVWMLKNIGMVESTYFTRHIPTIASAIEIVMIGFVVALKVKRNEEKRIIAEQKANESEELRRLLRVVCHDISNPLAVATAAYDKKRHVDASKAWEWVGRSLAMVEEIVTHVRKIEMIRSGKAELKLESVDVEKLVQDIRFVFQNKLEEKNIALESEMQTENHFVVAEKTSLLNDVVANFVSNSIKFSEPGSRITIICWQDPGTHEVNITIKDRGIGMSEKLIARLFDPSEQTSRLGTKSEKGTGFGMPLAKSYMDKYGGKISIQSTEKTSDSKDHGTITTLTFKCPK